MESKELVVRKKDYGWIVVVVALLVSIIGSVAYFSNRSAYDKDIYVSESSGDYVSGEIERIEIEKGKYLIVVENNEKKEYQENLKNHVTNNARIDKTKPMVALTFDDGPDPKRTLEIIDILKQYDVRASFFDIGNLMEKYPEIVKQEVEAECDVGGHTYSHVNLNDLSKEDIIEEIQKMEDVFEKITGKSLQYIRPTYGNANALVRSTVNRPLIDWTIDSRDWESRDTDKILEEIYQTDDFDGKIIILHVIYDTTVEAAKKLIPDLIQKGYQLVTISEMAEAKGVTLENGMVYYQF